MSDSVNHPKHYNDHPSGIECVDIAEHYDFLIGNVIKYAWRAGLKPGTDRLEDLKKMAWYAQRAVERETRATPPDTKPTSIFHELLSHLHDGTATHRPKGEDVIFRSDLEFVGGMADYKGKFIAACQRLIAVVHANARDKGFWDEPRNDGETLALMHSELSEALEALRTGNQPDDKIPAFSGVEAELADVIIRIFDYAGGRNLRVAEAVVAKIHYNKTRGRKHGKQF